MVISINNLSDINSIIEKTKFYSKKYGNIVIFTNGNDWYIHTLINNLLKSMEIHEPSRKIIVFCSDKDGYNKCSEIGFKHFEYVDIPELEVSSILSGSSADTKDYTRLSFVKIILMKHILELGYTPLYLDPDMAFLNPSIDDLISYLDKDDFVCAGTKEYLNSNIMIAKPTEFNKKLFELNLKDFNSILIGINTYGDEDLLRPRLIDQSFSCIDTELYPPGCDAIKFLNVAKIIHSNCVVGLENKIKLMKECNAWFLNRKKICSFTQTYNNDRNIIYKFKQYDDTDNYFRNKLSHNIYSFHGTNEQTRRNIINNPFLERTPFEIFTYPITMSYTHTYKQSLLKIKEKGYSYILFLQDDVFTVNQCKQDWDDLFHIIQNESFNLLSLETVYKSLENYKILFNRGNVNIYDTFTSTTCNEYMFGGFPFIANIDYLLSEMYDEEFFNCDFKTVEYFLSYRLKSVPCYSCNFQFYEKHNLCGQSNKEIFSTNILKMEQKYKEDIKKSDTNIISLEFVVDVKDIYPPFLEGELFETYFYNYIKTNKPVLNRKYINASWTNLYCNSQFKGISFNSEKLQKELDALPQDDKYFTIVQFDEGVKYHKLPPNTTILGCCFGDLPIPLTYETSAFSGKNFKNWNEKIIFCSFMGQHTHHVRKQVFEYIQKFPDYYYQVISELSTSSQKLYIERTMESKFCLAPRGFGRSSFRFFEILKLGSIPVYVWDDINWLPFKDTIDYSKLCVCINVKDLDNLDYVLRSITEKQYESMISYYNEIKYLFTYDGMCQEIIRIINRNIIIDSVGGVGDKLFGYVCADVISKQIGSNLLFKTNIFDSPNCLIKIKDIYKYTPVINTSDTLIINSPYDRQIMQNLFSTRTTFSKPNIYLRLGSYILDNFKDDLLPIYFKDNNQILKSIQQSLKKFLDVYTDYDYFSLYKKVSSIREELKHSLGKKFIVIHIRTGDDIFMLDRQSVIENDMFLKIHSIFRKISNKLEGIDCKLLLLSDLDKKFIHDIAETYFDKSLFFSYNEVKVVHSDRQNPSKEEWDQILDDILCIGESDICFSSGNSNFSRIGILMGNNNGKYPDYYFFNETGILYNNTNTLLSKESNDIKYTHLELTDKCLKPSICIVTIMIGNLPYKNKSKENHKKYCDKYGYAYVCLEDKINDYHPMWMKPDLILRELKKGYDYVFWMDGDSFFVNMDISFDVFIKYSEDLIATGDENDIVNTGHLLFKNSNWSHEFIKKWIAFRQPINLSVFEKFKNITTHFYKEDVDNNILLCDQPPFNLLLGGADEKYQEDWFDIFNKVNLYSGNNHKIYGIEYSPIKQENLERTNSLVCDSMKKHVRILEQCVMNSYPSTYKKGDFIIHFVTNK